jgi:hypothetical protein
MISESNVILDEHSLATLFVDTNDTQEVLIARSRAYLDARKLKEDAELLAKRQGEILNQAETELLRAMDGAQVKSLKIEHDGKLCGLTQTKKTFYSLPKAGDYEGAPTFIEDPIMLEWLDEHGGTDLIKKTIHHATFSSFCKELADQASCKINIEGGLIYSAGEVVDCKTADAIAIANDIECAEEFVKAYADKTLFLDVEKKIILNPAIKIAEKRGIQLRKG